MREGSAGWCSWHLVGLLGWDVGESGALVRGLSEVISWPALDSVPLTSGVLLKVVRSHGVGSSYTHCSSSPSSLGANFFSTDWVRIGGGWAASCHLKATNKLSPSRKTPSGCGGQVA